MLPKSRSRKPPVSTFSAPIIEDGKIDCVVVYKVDRLSRSLIDFAKMMELFERHGICFVSITQQFNTNSSLGRLTLNILLSFAQFEREIISERTRDKQVAARKKGKWTGGHILLGYDLDSRAGKLIVNSEEAERVREMFRLYLEGASVVEIVQRCDCMQGAVLPGGLFHHGLEQPTLLAGGLLEEQFARPTRQAKHVDGIIDWGRRGLLDILDPAQQTILLPAQCDRTWATADRETPIPAEQKAFRALLQPGVQEGNRPLVHQLWQRCFSPHRFAQCSKSREEGI